MQGNRFTIAFHIPGTLAANITPVFAVPFDCSLVQAQAVSTNASNATIKIGTTSDDDAYLTASDVSDSSVPSAFTRANFVGAADPHITAGTVMLITVDFDGASGTAAQNLTLLLTFSEG